MTVREADKSKGGERFEAGSVDARVLEFSCITDCDDS